MTTNSIFPVTTGIKPIYDPDRGYRQWLRSQVYTGPNGTGEYVPNVDDSVIDYAQGFFRVSEVDTTGTMLSTLVPWSPPKSSDDFNQEDVLLDNGLGYNLPAPCYIDKSVFPHTLNIDNRLKMYGSKANYIKVFKGADIGVAGTVISAMYDNTNTLLGENIPLELAKVDTTQVNNSIKVPAPGYTTHDLEDGELLTAVVYNAEGGVISRSALLVYNSALVRATEASTRYVTGIELVSPFLSKTDSRTLEVPLNVTLAGVSMYGIVRYSDGKSKNVTIDGSRLSLLGLTTYVATILGQKAPLVLDYKLDSNEVAYNAAAGLERHISVRYDVKTVEADGAYSPKLFVYPVWIDDVNGYDLEFWLYNLDRDQVYSVTDKVKLGANSAAYRPTRYGVTQDLSYAINLADVDSRFSAYRHVQTVSITLFHSPIEAGTPWTVGYTPNQAPQYGDGLEAQVEYFNAGYSTVNLVNGIATLDEWLEQLYYATKPLVNTQAEVIAPRPTHFVIVAASDVQARFELSQWNTDLQISTNMIAGETLLIQWINADYDTELQLGLSGLNVRHVN